MEKRERSSLSKSHLRKPEAGQIGSLPLTWRLTYELIELEVKIHVRTCQSIPHKKTMNEEDENFSNVTSIDSTSVTSYVTSMLSGRTQHLEQQLNDLPPHRRIEKFCYLRQRWQNAAINEPQKNAANDRGSHRQFACFVRNERLSSSAERCDRQGFVTESRGL